VQHSNGVTVTIQRNGKAETRNGRWLIGADGARSDVRRSLDIPFDGFTWPERFLVVSTPFDFYGVIEGLAPVSYVADPQRWRFLLQIPGLWRVMFPVAEHESDETALSPEFAQALMATIVPGIADYEIAHTTLYKVHQRVAKTLRLGNAFLAGDAAHINNPLGGMGMNGGIHDVMNLTARLAEVWHGRAANPMLDLYDRERAGDTGIHRSAVEPEQAQPRIRRYRLQGPARSDRRGSAAHPRLPDARVDDRESAARQGTRRNAVIRQAASPPIRT
jgi:3-(3-hydroxy-phenyl)propionate hydroxylase